MKTEIKNAIYVIDELITIHRKCSKGMRELIKDWSSGPEGLGEEIALVHDRVAVCLEYVKEILEKKATIKKKNTKSKYTLEML